MITVNPSRTTGPRTTTHRAQRDHVLQSIQHNGTTYYNPLSTTGPRTITHRAQREDHVLKPIEDNGTTYYNPSSITGPRTTIHRAQRDHVLQSIQHNGTTYYNRRQQLQHVTDVTVFTIPEHVVLKRLFVIILIALVT